MCVKVISTSLVHLGDAQAFDLSPSGQEALAMRVIRGQLQDIAMMDREQPRREHEDFLAQRGEPGLLPGSGQAESSEPVDQIVGQQNEFEVNSVGRETCGGDFA